MSSHPGEAIHARTDHPLDSNKDDHDDLVFLDEQPAPPLAIAPRSVWRVMIIDDDEDVHSTTTFALGNLEMQHRPLEFVHAYSAGQARELLKHENDIAVILLDVVMEQDDAGLHLVRYIRENTENDGCAHHPAHGPARLWRPEIDRTPRHTISTTTRPSQS